MIFSATNPVDNLPKNVNMHSSCKNPSASPNGVETKPRLVFRIKLPPSLNEGKKPCKVVKDREDEKPVPTFSSGTNGIEKKPPLVLRIKFPPAHNKEKKSCKAKNDEVDQKLVPTTSNGIGIRNGCMNSCSKNPISCCPTKSASKVARKHKSDKKPAPTSSGGVNCAEKKACHVMRSKFPTPSNSGGHAQSDPKSAMGGKLVLMPSSGMSGTGGDGKKGVMSAVLHQNKEEQLNIRKTAVQQTGSTNGSSALAKTADKICLGKLQMDEEALELKLEASKRKLHKRYQQAQNAKRKIELIDSKDIPKPENVAKKSKMQHRR